MTESFEPKLTADHIKQETSINGFMLRQLRISILYQVGRNSWPFQFKYGNSASVDKNTMERK